MPPSRAAQWKDLLLSIRIIPCSFRKNTGRRSTLLRGTYEQPLTLLLTLHADHRQTCRTRASRTRYFRTCGPAYFSHMPHPWDGALAPALARTRHDLSRYPHVCVKCDRGKSSFISSRPQSSRSTPSTPSKCHLDSISHPQGNH